MFASCQSEGMVYVYLALRYTRYTPPVYTAVYTRIYTYLLSQIHVSRILEVPFRPVNSQRNATRNGGRRRVVVLEGTFRGVALAVCESTSSDGRRGYLPAAPTLRTSTLPPHHHLPL